MDRMYELLYGGKSITPVSADLKSYRCPANAFDFRSAQTEFIGCGLAVNLKRPLFSKESV